MIDRISFKNYKIFKERQHIAFKPITILIGKNNSGKSAIAKLPTLIEGAFDTESTEALLFDNEDIELGAELRDLVYGKSLRVLEFDMEQDRKEDTTLKLSVGVLISQEKTKQSSTIAHWKLDNLLDLEDTGDKQTFTKKSTGESFICEFNGFKLKKIKAVKDKEEQWTKVDSVFSLKTDFIGPIRVHPLRDYRQPAALKTDKFGQGGENAYFYLIDDALTSDKRLLGSVSKWYKDNFEGWELKVNQDKAPVFQIEIHRDDLKQNILDTGIGMSQVLPIITRALMPCEEETLIIIEEPETHLHPAAHGNLASLLVDSLSQGNKKYLVETHSLNFVLRLRRLVAEGKLNKDSLGIYYVDFSEEENFSTVSEISVDDLGRVSHWPKGVFDETLDETVGIRTAQYKKRSNDN